MIEVFKILHDFYDTKDSSPLIICSLESLMDLKGHDLTLPVCQSNKKQRAQSFTQRVVKPRHSIPLKVF